MISTPEIHQKLRANRLTVRFSFLPKRLSRCSTVLRFTLRSKINWTHHGLQDTQFPPWFPQDFQQENSIFIFNTCKTRARPEHITQLLKLEVWPVWCASLKIELKYRRYLSIKKTWHVTVLPKKSQVNCFSDNFV